MTIQTGQSRQDNQDRTIKTGQLRLDNPETPATLGGKYNIISIKRLIQQRLLLSLHNRTRTTLITLYFEGHISTHRPVTFSFSYEQPF